MTIQTFIAVKFLPTPATASTLKLWKYDLCFIRKSVRCASVNYILRPNTISELIFWNFSIPLRRELFSSVINKYRKQQRQDLLETNCFFYNFPINPADVRSPASPVAFPKRIVNFFIHLLIRLLCKSVATGRFFNFLLIGTQFLRSPRVLARKKTAEARARGCLNFASSSLHIQLAHYTQPFD